MILGNENLKPIGLKVMVNILVCVCLFCCTVYHGKWTKLIIDENTDFYIVNCAMQNNMKS